MDNAGIHKSQKVSEANKGSPSQAAGYSEHTKLIILEAPWRDLPASYGGWKNTHRRFCRWRDKGIWEKLMEQLIGEHELERRARVGGVF